MAFLLGGVTWGVQSVAFVRVLSYPAYALAGPGGNRFLIACSYRMHLVSTSVCLPEKLEGFGLEHREQLARHRSGCACYT